jgi:hypothetical protein
MRQIRGLAQVVFCAPPAVVSANYRQYAEESAKRACEQVDPHRWADHDHRHGRAQGAIPYHAAGLLSPLLRDPDQAEAQCRSDDSRHRGDVLESSRRSHVHNLVRRYADREYPIHPLDGTHRGTSADSGETLDRPEVDSGDQVAEESAKDGCKQLCPNGQRTDVREHADPAVEAGDALAAGVDVLRRLQLHREHRYERTMERAPTTSTPLALTHDFLTCPGYPQGLRGSPGKGTFSRAGSEP